MGVPGYETSPDNVRLLPERLQTPLSWKKPRFVFVNSMADVFHPEVPFDFILQLDHYEDELRKIGYEHTAGDRPVTNSNNTPLCHLVFGSKNKLGKTLRDAVSQKTLSGQLTMLG